eukprot:COSAG02_NODE_44463_length_366_cov_0.584270_1_plen_49_part_01
MLQGAATATHTKPALEGVTKHRETIPCVELASKCGFVFTPEATSAINQA